MRLILLAAPALALAVAACGGRNDDANENNAAAAADTMAIDSNMSMGNMAMDANMLDQNVSMTGTTGAAASDANTAAAMAKDATTHDPDTNLANGM